MKSTRNGNHRYVRLAYVGHGRLMYDKQVNTRRLELGVGFPHDALEYLEHDVAGCATGNMVVYTRMPSSVASPARSCCQHEGSYI